MVFPSRTFAIPFKNETTDAQTSIIGFVKTREKYAVNICEHKSLEPCGQA